MNADRSQKIIIAVLAVLLVVVSGALVRQTYFSDQSAPVAIVPVENNNSNLPPTGNANTNAPTFILSVDWLPTPVIEPALGVSSYTGMNLPAKTADTGIDISYKWVGNVTNGQYANSPLYYIGIPCELSGPKDNNCTQTLAIVPPNGHLFIILPRYSQSQSSVVGSILNATVANSDLVIPDLNPPALQIPLSQKGYSLTRTGMPQGLPDSTKHGILGSADDGTQLFTDPYTGNPAVQLKNGELIDYKLNIPFFADGKIPKITWKDGTPNTGDYSYMVTGGCGSTDEPDLLKNELIENNIINAGTTSTGETVYTYKDSNEKSLKDLYDSWYVSTGTKPSYSKFLTMHPMFVWKDPFGRFIRWTMADIQPMAECGKPVVYLYPNKTEQVAVKLGNNITVTKSEPAYQNGWKVTAQSNGTLTTADGATYPYLYWDGNGASYKTPTTGFAVARNDVEATLKAKLTQLGLNAKEIADFNEFWLPIVTKSPYTLISFVPQDEWSKAAPLSISPAPQTVIRVFMDWKPLSAPISIAPQTLPPTPIRTGFTAVEWGGLLYR